jgi:hypothetical protein
MDDFVGYPTDEKIANVRVASSSHDDDPEILLFRPIDNCSGTRDCFFVNLS